MKNQGKRILGLALFTLMLAYLGISSWLSLNKLFEESRPGFEAVSRDEKILVIKLGDSLEGANLRVGDEIVGVENFSEIKPRDFLSPILGVKSATPLSLIVRRDGQTFESPILTAPLEVLDWIKAFGNILAPWTFILIGLVVLLLRADDEQAWLLSMVLGAFGGLFGFDNSNAPIWVIAIKALTQTLGLLFFPLFFSFFLLFPERSSLVNRWPRLKFYLYFPFLFLILPIQLLSLYSSFSPGIFRNIAQWFGQMLNWIIVGSIIFYLFAGMVALIGNYRTADLEARRKLHLIVAGCSAAILNLVLIFLIEFFNFRNRFSVFYDWLQFLANFTLPLIPISFAYAIIKHQVIPISLIVRRGMRYLLVSRGSVLLEIAFFSILLSVFLTIFFHYYFSVFKPQNLETLGMTIGIVSATVAIISWNVTRRLHQKYLAPIIDRKFFRQSYDSHQIITGLAESLRSTATHSEILEEVATKIQSALQTESVAILLKDERSGDFVSTYYCEFRQADGCAVNCDHDFLFAKESQVVQLLSSMRKCIEATGLPIPDDEAATLQKMKSSLLLPLTGKHEMLGIISLGPRLGDLPFSREDEELLLSIAGPVSLAIENSQLVEQRIADARRRQELEAENEARAKELEEARQLQLSMLPKKVPQLPNLEIAVFMKTATEVGGDYYDFHISSDGTLTIAVGDATGHGLKAGTIVTATKSLFNNLAILTDITEIFRQSSRALKQMNLRSLYMAMTMIKLQDENLSISSAGMPPVLIYRSLFDTVDEISLPGMPLGSITNYPYQLRSLQVVSGDVIMLLSDGFPERFNERGEMLGYHKPAEILAQSASASAQQIINRFIQVGDEWAGNQPQDDDVTFVVIKIKK